MKSQEESPDLPVVTADGSHTLFHTVLKEHYHSLQGSLQESEHIYIGLGLLPKTETPGDETIEVFEMGFGTGLNALLTWKTADRLRRPVRYTGIEAYPVGDEQSALLNYEALAGKGGLEILHSVSWGERHTLSPWFSFCKINAFLEEYAAEGAQYDVVYFDAFSPGTQPELWTTGVFARVARLMKQGGYLVTYSSKGSVRRALKEAGFRVEKHPGPGIKREVIRAVKE